MHLPWREMAPAPGPTILTSLLAEEAAKLAELAKGADVLEVGAAFGFSTVTLALTAQSVVSVDPHTAHDSYGTMWANLAAYRVAGRVSAYRCPSQDAGVSLRQAGTLFDVVFVDGDHRAAGVEHDVRLALDVLRPGGVLACHDYGEDCCCPEVRPTLDGLFPNGPDELVGTLFVVRP